MSNFKKKIVKLFYKVINRETIFYVIFGIITAVVNFFVFCILIHFGINYKWANLTALIITKIVAYLTNKLFVFRTKTNSFHQLFKEIFLFILARGASGVFDFFALIIAIDLLHFNPKISKLVIQMLVIIMNYFLGKFLVFKPKKNRG